MLEFINLAYEKLILYEENLNRIISNIKNNNINTKINTNINTNLLNIETTISTIGTTISTTTKPINEVIEQFNFMKELYELLQLYLPIYQNINNINNINKSDKLKDEYNNIISSYSEITNKKNEINKKYDKYIIIVNKSIIERTMNIINDQFFIDLGNFNIPNSANLTDTIEKFKLLINKYGI
jgi:hypothetical protein